MKTLTIGKDLVVDDREVLHGLLRWCGPVIRSDVKDKESKVVGYLYQCDLFVTFPVIARREIDAVLIDDLDSVAGVDFEAFVPQSRVDDEKTDDLVVIKGVDLRPFGNRRPRSVRLVLR